MNWSLHFELLFGQVPHRVAEQLNAAGKNGSQLVDALKAVPEKQREGLAFLIANMPLGILSRSRKTSC